MGMVGYDNEFETKESKLELQQIQSNKMAADHRNSHWPPKRKKISLYLKMLSRFLDHR